MGFTFQWMYWSGFKLSSSLRSAYLGCNWLDKIEHNLHIILHNIYIYIMFKIKFCITLNIKHIILFYLLSLIHFNFNRSEFSSKDVKAICILCCANILPLNYRTSLWSVMQWKGLMCGPFLFLIFFFLFWQMQIVVAALFW